MPLCYLRPPPREPPLLRTPPPLLREEEERSKLEEFEERELERVLLGRL